MTNLIKVGTFFIQKQKKKTNWTFTFYKKCCIICFVYYLWTLLLVCL